MPKSRAPCRCAFRLTCGTPAGYPGRSPLGRQLKSALQGKRCRARHARLKPYQVALSSLEQNLQGITQPGNPGIQATRSPWRGL